MGQEIKPGDIVTTFRPELKGSPLKPWEWHKVKKIFVMAGVTYASLYRPSTGYKTNIAINRLFIVPDNLISYE